MSSRDGSNYKAELEGIKAPLGVILYLIKRDNIDIYDIPIAKITKDYLAYLDDMEKRDIDLAGEFFVLAATLMRIKAQMLLRRDDEGEEDPREELVRNLLEYKKMVEAARRFQDLEDERSKVFSRPVPQEEKEFRGEPIFELNLYEVMRAFREIMTEFEGSAEREIDPEVFTVEEKIEAITTSLAQDGQVAFKELFAGTSSRLEVVVTFIAMLEMIKRSMITARQDKLFGEIWLYPAEPRDDSDADDGSEPDGNIAGAESGERGDAEAGNAEEPVADTEDPAAGTTNDGVAVTTSQPIGPVERAESARTFTSGQETSTPVASAEEGAGRTSEKTITHDKREEK